MATDICLNAVCNQRIRQMLFTIPPTRYNPISPYPQYTQEQLNMRRKAEILEYSATKTNSKTNNYTKAEKYSLLIGGKNQTNSYPIIYQPSFKEAYYKINLDGRISLSDITGNNINSNVVVDGDISQLNIKITPAIIDFSFTVIKPTINGNCNTDMMPRPTSSSGVPGKIINLALDPTVPLYNYATNNNAYSFNPIKNSPMWNTRVNNNIYCNQSLDTIIFSLGILDPIDQPSYNFSFSTPFSIYYSCNYNGSLNNGAVAISSITPKVFYSGSQITYLNPSWSYSINSVSNVTFNISQNNGTVPSYVQVYSGILTVSNLNLFTVAGYVYDIALNFNLNSTVNVNTAANNTINNINLGVYCNLTQPLTVNTRNCTVTNNPAYSTTPYTPFNITAT